jgi:hypothetical protein
MQNGWTPYLPKFPGNLIAIMVPSTFTSSLLPSFPSKIIERNFNNNNSKLPGINLENLLSSMIDLANLHKHSTSSTQRTLPLSTLSSLSMHPLFFSKFAIFVHAVVISRKPSEPDLPVFIVTSPTPPGKDASLLTSKYQVITTPLTEAICVNDVCSFAPLDGSLGMLLFHPPTQEILAL